MEEHKTGAAEEGARPRGRPRDPAKDEAILVAAANLFMDQGFEATSVDAIAEAAGVAKVTIYARFPDKESLFRAVLEHKCDALMNPAVFEVLDHEPPRAALLRLGRSFLDLILDPQAVSMNRVMVGEAARGGPMAALFFENAVNRVCARVAGMLEREVARGRLRPLEPRAAAWRFLGAVKGEAHMRALLALPPMPPESLQAHLEACVTDFLAAHAIAEKPR